MGFPDGSASKESACGVGDLSIPGSGRSPGEENCYLLQYSCVQNLMNRGAWQAAVHRVAESRTRVRTNTFTLSHTQITWLLPIDSLIQIHRAGTQGTEHVSRPTPRTARDRRGYQEAGGPQPSRPEPVSENLRVSSSRHRTEAHR